ISAPSLRRGRDVVAWRSKMLRPSLPLSRAFGGGIKASGYEMPVICNRNLRTALVVFGIALLAIPQIVACTSPEFKVASVGISWDRDPTFGCNDTANYTMVVKTNSDVGDFQFRENVDGIKGPINDQAVFTRRTNEYTGHVPIDQPPGTHYSHGLYIEVISPNELTSNTIYLNVDC
ncbi:hypothetical protein ACFWWS_39930, partial [Streptomyces sp. NPDC059083]|uniref:hypothetical protein n=1 Tax=Streptomyces sp. NPDC059083 TaxID=3346721 RepID=UPI0036AE602C